MKRQKGFTLVEIMIAVAIIAIMLAVGLSRFSGLLTNQTAGLSLQRLTECIQYGQRTAMAPPVDQDVRYVAVELQSRNTGNGSRQLNCRAYTLGTNTLSSNLNGQTPASGTIVKESDFSNLYLNQATAAQTDTLPATTLPNLSNGSSWLYFGSYERGTVVNLYPASGSAVLPSIYGQGLVINLQVSLSDGSTATIHIPRLGSPIDSTTN